LEGKRIKKWHHGSSHVALIAFLHFSAQLLWASLAQVKPGELVCYYDMVLENLHQLDTIDR
jgi:hypothetical protein